MKLKGVEKYLAIKLERLGLCYTPQGSGHLSVGVKSKKYPILQQCIIIYLTIVRQLG